MLKLKPEGFADPAWSGSRVMGCALILAVIMSSFGSINHITDETTCIARVSHDTAT